MKKKLTLTIDSDVYDGLEDLPRKVSVSEFVNFMLKAYIEVFKKGGLPSDEQLDEVVEKMGGEEFRERLRAHVPFLECSGAYDKERHGRGRGVRERLRHKVRLQKVGGASVASRGCCATRTCREGARCR